MVEHNRETRVSFLIKKSFHCTRFIEAIKTKRLGGKLTIVLEPICVNFRSSAKHFHVAG